MSVLRSLKTSVLLLACLGLPALSGCSAAKPTAPEVEGAQLQGESHKITIIAQVPERSSTVYLAGNLPSLGPWKADGAAMTGEGATRTITLDVPHGFALEYKITLGEWSREGTGPSGTVMPNFTLTANADQSVTVSVTDFKKDPVEYLNDPAGSGVLGTLIAWQDVAGAGLSEDRHIYVWTPLGYEDNPQQRYRVLYMHDGQNLFDPRLANTGSDWGVDEALVALMQAGKIPPTMVVGMFSTNDRRLEYAPQRVIEALPDAVEAEVLAEFAGTLKGDAYLDFIVNEVKPRVDANFRTLPDRANTFIAGSSMGALISLYAVSEKRDAFGGAACFSMHWPVAINGERIFEGASEWQPLITDIYRTYLAESGPDPHNSRLWVDRGTLNLDSLYKPYQDALIPVLQARGFVVGDSLEARVFEGTDHNEAAWRARGEEVFGWLLRP